MLLQQWSSSFCKHQQCLRDSSIASVYHVFRRGKNRSIQSHNRTTKITTKKKLAIKISRLPSKELHSAPKSRIINIVIVNNNWQLTTEVSKSSSSLAPTNTINTTDDHHHSATSVTANLNNHHVRAVYAADLQDNIDGPLAINNSLIRWPSRVELEKKKNKFISSYTICPLLPSTLNTTYQRRRCGSVIGSINSQQRVVLNRFFSSRSSSDSIFFSNKRKQLTDRSPALSQQPEQQEQSTDSDNTSSSNERFYNDDQLLNFEQHLKVSSNLSKHEQTYQVRPKLCLSNDNNNNHDDNGDRTDDEKCQKQDNRKHEEQQQDELNKRRPHDLVEAIEELASTSQKRDALPEQNRIESVDKQNKLEKIIIDFHETNERAQVNDGAVKDAKNKLLEREKNNCVPENIEKAHDKILSIQRKLESLLDTSSIALASSPLDASAQNSSGEIVQPHLLIDLPKMQSKKISDADSVGNSVDDEQLSERLADVHISAPDSGPFHQCRRPRICAATQQEAQRQSSRERIAKQVMTGKRQSPISLMNQNPVYRHCSKPLELEYPATLDNLKLNNTGFTWEVKLPYQQSMLTSLSGGSLPYLNRYRLDQFHCHWGADNRAGSEHSVDGHLYTAELHFVHYNMEKYHSMSKAQHYLDGLAVVAVFLEATNDHLNHAELEKICSNLRLIQSKGDSVTLKQSIRLDNLLPTASRSYWTYHGSLTTPPYYESVTWFVLKQPIRCSVAQIDKFRQIHGAACCSHLTSSTSASNVQNKNVGVESVREARLEKMVLHTRTTNNDDIDDLANNNVEQLTSMTTTTSKTSMVDRNSSKNILSNHRATQPLHGRVVCNHDDEYPAYPKSTIRL